MERFTSIAFVLGFGLAFGQAEAGSILQVDSVSSSAGSLIVPGIPANSEPVEDLINQSGLTANYVSGVTDFDSFVSTTLSVPRNGWAAGFGTQPPAFLDFDLGGEFFIDAMAFWGVDGVAAIRDFSLLASLQDDFSDATVLGNYSAETQFALNPAQVFTFAPTNARFVRLSYTSNFGSTSRAGAASEVAFRSFIIPEPSSLALMVVGVAGLIALRWRQSRPAT